MTSATLSTLGLPLRRGVIFTSKTFIALVIIVLMARACLPYVVHQYVNRVLNRLPEYKGHTADIDIALIRGAYVINGLVLQKKNGTVLQPFLDIEATDLSVEWKALFHGKFVGEIVFKNPVFNFVNSDSPAQQQLSTKGDWQSVVKDLFPIDINRTEVQHGTITYRHEGTKDAKSITISKVDGMVTGLTNHPQPEDLLPAKAAFTGNLQTTTPVKVNIRIDPLSKSPTFDADFSTAVLPLTQVNHLLRETAGVDAEDGTIQLFAEVACKNGSFEGYVKPILRNVQLFSPEEDVLRPAKLLWEGIVSLVTEVFTNQKHEQFAAKIPFNGKLTKTDVDIWTSLETIVQNAFIQALKAKIDDDVSLRSANE